MLKSQTMERCGEGFGFSGQLKQKKTGKFHIWHTSISSNNLDNPELFSKQDKILGLFCEVGNG